MDKIGVHLLNLSQNEIKGSVFWTNGTSHLVTPSVNGIKMSKAKFPFNATDLTAATTGSILVLLPLLQLFVSYLSCTC